MTTVKFSDTAAGGQAPSPGAAAFVASRLGFRVFPLRPGVGTPAVRAWPDLATADEDRIQEWWTGEYAGHGVGIATGPESGVWVLDIDVKKGVDGSETLRALFNVYSDPGGVRAIGRTLTVATPSGGAHLYFRWNDEAGSDGGVHNSTGGTNALGPGLDVRGIRGYVRAPGWAGYQVVPREGVRSVGIVAAPGWLVALAKSKPSRERWERSEGGDNEPNGGPRVLGTVRTLDALGAAPSGTRNNELNRAAFRLGMRGELSKEDAWAQCRLIMVSIGANDDERAQRRTFESGWDDGVAKRG